jgi:DNA repair protein RadC
VKEDQAPSARLVDRLLRDGSRSLSDAELVAVLLHSTCRNGSAVDLAHRLLDDLDGLAGLGEVDRHVLERPGIGRVRAAVLLATRELAARFGRSEMIGRRVLDRPRDIATYVSLRHGQGDQEVLGVLLLDLRQRLITEHELCRGTISTISVEPRQVLRTALVHNATSVVLFHTHPSNDPTPSQEDIAFTRRTAQVCRLVGVRLVDHLVVGGLGRWVSISQSEGF